MLNHPENNGYQIYTSHAEDVLKAAERIVRMSKYKHILSRLGRGAMDMVASYGMTPAMYAELHANDK